MASIKQTEKFTTELLTGAYRKFCETSKFWDIFALFFIIQYPLVVLTGSVLCILKTYISFIDFPMYLNFETMLFISLLLCNVHVYCTSMYVSWYERLVPRLLLIDHKTDHLARSNQFQQRMIPVTHFSPSRHISMAPKYSNHNSITAHCSYCSKLTLWINWHLPFNERYIGMLKLGVNCLLLHAFWIEN